MLLFRTVGVMRLSSISVSAVSVLLVLVKVTVVLCLEGGDPDPVPVVVVEEGIVRGLSVEDVRPGLRPCLLLRLLLPELVLDSLELSMAEGLSCAVVAVASLASFMFMFMVVFAMFMVSLSAVTLLLSFETGDLTAGASGCAAGTRETESERPSGSSCW